MSNSNINDIFSLQGKVIWVFGGAGYLGQAIVLLLQTMEAKVLCIDLENRAENFVASASLSGNITPASLDVRNSAETKKFIATHLSSRGVPHGLVNLTYTSTAKKLEDLEEKYFDDANHGGLTATFLIARAVGLAMVKEKRGSIILFSSIYGSVSPNPEVYDEPLVKNPIEYGVGKAGIAQMTRYLGVHWGKENVRCNCISPGPFPNPEVQRKHPSFIEKLAQKSPMGRIGQSKEIAGTVAFLLSDAASYITGQNLFVDGGWTAW
jgi:NAD(P)-dependent dehydrogenase (short-subunit alcohol dehydrogenase family)